MRGIRNLSLAVLLLAGCVHVAQEPGLPMPERPRVRILQAPNGFCMDEESFVNLVNFIKKLNEFEAARARLLAP